MFSNKPLRPPENCWIFTKTKVHKGWLGLLIWELLKLCFTLFRGVKEKGCKYFENQVSFCFTPLLWAELVFLVGVFFVDFSETTLKLWPTSFGSSRSQGRKSVWCCCKTCNGSVRHQHNKLHAWVYTVSQQCKSKVILNHKLADKLLRFAWKACEWL